MKYLLIILAFTINIYSSFSQWTILPQDAFNRDSIFQPTFHMKSQKDVLILTGLKYQAPFGVNYRALYYSNNQGMTFNLIDKVNQISLSGMSGHLDTVFVDMGNKILVRSFNFGIDWDTLSNFGIPYYLGNGLLILLRDTSIFLSSDYGQNWKLQSSGLKYASKFKTFKSSGHVIYFNELSNSIEISDDFGESFRVISQITGIGSTNYSFYFLDEKNGFLMKDKELLKTNDGYRTWTVIKNFSNRVNHNAEGLYFINLKDGFYVKGGELFKTNDSGKTWCLQPPSTFGSYGLTSVNNFFNMYFMNDSIGFYSPAGGPGGQNFMTTTNQGGPPCPSDTTIKGLGAELGFNQLKVFPNPSAGLLTLALEQGQLSQVQLFSMEGRLVFSQKLSEQEVTLQLPSISPGIYMLEVQSTANKVFRQKLVIE